MQGHCSELCCINMYFYCGMTMETTVFFSSFLHQYFPFNTHILSLSLSLRDVLACCISLLNDEWSDIITSFLVMFAVCAVTVGKLYRKK